MLKGLNCGEAPITLISYNVIGNDKRECGTAFKMRQSERIETIKIDQVRGNRVCKSLPRIEISLAGNADGERSESIIP